jgi:hypothetical protein
MHNKYIITYECHDNAPRMWKVVQLIREIFWLLPVLSPLLPVVSHFSFVSTWKRSHYICISSRPLKSVNTWNRSPFWNALSCEFRCRWRHLSCKLCPEIDIRFTFTLIKQGSHYFEIRGRSDFSFRCWQKRSYNVCKSERWYANKNKDLKNYWIYLNA